MFRFIRNPDPTKKPPYGSRLDPTHPLGQGLIGCWLLNEGGGKKVFNILDNIGGDFTNGPTWEAESVNFVESSSQYINTNVAGVLGGNPRTVFGTIMPKHSSYTSRAQCSGIVWWGGTTTNGTRFSIMYNFDASQGTMGALRTEIQGTNKVASTALAANNKYHFAVTVSGSNFPSTCKFYIDGKDDGSSGSSTAITMNTSAANAIHLGVDNPGSLYYLDGWIYNLGIFDRVLSDSEIYQLYAEPYANILVPKYWYVVDFALPGTTYDFSGAPIGDSDISQSALDVIYVISASPAGDSVFSEAILLKIYDPKIETILLDSMLHTALNLDSYIH